MNYDDVEAKEILAKKIAAMYATGITSERAIAKELQVSPYVVRKVRESPEYLNVVKGIGDEVLTQAKGLIRSETAKLAKEAIRVLKAQLKDNNLDAVKVALKVLGFEDKNEEKGDTNIQVVLPTSSTEGTAIEVNYDRIQDKAN